MDPKICLDHLIKVYGDAPRIALKLFREGQTRDAILEATGQVVGVADVSLSIQPGELFVVMGLSGSGKSTLVRCINRLIHPTSGHIYIDDEEVAHVDEKRMREIRLTKISMVFQRFGLFPHKTVFENVAYGLKIRGVRKAQRRQKVLETLERVGLVTWADAMPAALSGGMQQRVGLARALATEAEILLMDEPFSALDPLIRREMQDELLRLQRDLHKTIVFISHDIHEALKLGDRIAVMKEGAIVQVGTPDTLITQPTSDYIRAFTQDVNRAQFLTAGSIARVTSPLPLDQTTGEIAWAQIEHQDLQYLYFVDRQDKLIGCLAKPDLERILQQNSQDIVSVLQTAFPQVQASTPLDQTLNLYHQGLPVAVVDQDETLVGTLTLSDVLNQIGKHHPDVHETLD